ncbi:hypothetical protein BAUCODRAFT_139136 [Baudoinia panamericana UAMH 10762]|uniref:Trafficking protein particle complex subunit 10 n=1 Tax=Baudoinia panamericana (strain UAMH 10762) TaxID=717646 RepID=M2NAX7_BAUPA|nr:uncharacterized protein BAUCODRAFT_139136 [Baudoinia panamericana UAMH 10762]EMC96304.1 hypothetical protein BAUCODRAFT_139136 [Baudoinia panamericana UAMH 10762]
MNARAMEASSSSKVTVEYHDPSGVFPLISREIAGRLPLRNLNWQSPSRPLRQIRQLHVDFVPDKFTETALRPPIQRFDSNGPTSVEIVRSGRRDAVKERRHQIPGLKTSPYLKLYVLRCDDKDTYKDTERKRIREWLRDSTQAESSTGDNHDAFEWLILHVVVPGTTAASEPRWRESVKEPDELKERKTSNVKFPGKPPRTVFDRLRADFNDSGKAGVDRVAQIRLLKQNMPPDLLPTPTVAETLEETTQERELSWKDLLDKLKVLILGPFDARVRQYEVDIAEQESRRSLPGWNFCTFFIHKEGLAKALESIGLVEDALALYDELSLGLETAVREIASGQADGTATSFAAYTNDIVDRILGFSKATMNGAMKRDSNGLQHSSGAGLFSKDYREEIVRSNISVFDFFCYLFIRQKALILRLANTAAANAELGAARSSDSSEDLVLISEVCWRASSFIPNSARSLRQELQSMPKSTEKALNSHDVDAITYSWIYLVAGYILSETIAPVLDLVQLDSNSKPLVNGTSPQRSDFSFAMGASPYPERSSSLAVRQSAPDLHRPSVAMSEESAGTITGSEIDLGTKAAGIPGLPELATYRAELVVMQRKMLEDLAQHRGWLAGWAAVEHSKPRLEDVELDASNNDERAESAGGIQATPETEPIKSASIALVPPSLATALESEQAFQSAFERLSDQAMRYYAVATQSKSVDLIIGDLALLKRQQGDTVTAEDYIRHLLPSFEADTWSSTEAELLLVYISCLEELQRHLEHLEAVLKLLSKVAKKRMVHTSFVTQIYDDFDVSGVLQKAIDISAAHSIQLDCRLEDFFGDVQFDEHIVHHDDMDGFTLRLRLRHVLDDAVEVEEVAASLVAAQDPAQVIMLRCARSVVVRPGLVDVNLDCSTSALGPFLLGSLKLKARGLTFVKDFQPSKAPTVLVNGNGIGSPAPVRNEPLQSSVFLYPSESSFNLQAELVRDIRLDKPRHLLLTLSSGRNEVEGVDLRIKPTSAGLRLHLADADLEGIVLSGGGGKPGQLAMSSLSAGQSALITIPYTVDQATPDISMRFEVHYRTPKGPFTYLTSTVLRHELPLDVEVNERFRMKYLTSSFTLRTLRPAPLLVLDTHLRESMAYTVEASSVPSASSTITETMPARLRYKIFRKAPSSGKMIKRNASLALDVKYVSFVDLIATTVRESFAEFLNASGCRPLRHLLCPIMDQKVWGLLHAPHVELSAVSQQLRMPSFQEFGWNNIIDTLPPGAKPDVEACLQKWHSEHITIATATEGALTEKVARCVTIAVDVPTVDIVFNASMIVQDKGYIDVPGQKILILGTPVTAEISVRHTFDWSASSVFGSKQLDSKTSFVIEIQADREAWLVGGRRRARVTLDMDNTVLGIVLVPLRLGTLALPHVTVQAQAPTTNEGGSQEAKAMTLRDQVLRDRAQLPSRLLSPDEDTRPYQLATSH